MQSATQVLHPRTGLGSWLSQPRWEILLAVFSLVMGLASGELEAQETTEEDVPPPLPALIVTIGGVDRAMEDLSRMFEISGRPDMVDVVENFIKNVAGDLKGVDRTKPAGFMLFLEPGLPPQPQGVAFVPIDNLDDILKTAGLGPLKPEKKEGTEDRFELRGGRRGVHVKVANGYAYISRSEDLIEEDLPDPLTTFSSFASKYDLSVSFQVRNIPLLIRDVFATMLEQQVATQLQQRDDESDAAYEIRKANGLSTSQVMEQILRQGEEITIGLDASADGGRALIDVLTVARPDSEFAKYLKGIGGRPSMFTPVVEDESRPLTVSLSWTMDKREQEAATGFFKGIKLTMLEQLGEELGPTLEDLFAPINATIERGHADAFLQFAPQEQDEFVLIGGLRVLGGEKFGAALQDTLFALLEDPEVKLKDIELNVHEHQGVTFHKLTGGNASDGDKRLYGGEPSAFIGTDSRALWFAVGADGAIPAIEQAIDKVASASGGLPTSTRAPFQLVFRLAPWLRLPAPEEEDPTGREIAEQALDEGQDAVRVEVRPTDTGSRFRIQFDETFVRILGNALAHQYDQSQL